jgi:UPF0176 protein
MQTVDVTAEPMCLHAHELTFQHPITRQPVRFTAPAPEWAI